MRQKARVNSNLTLGGSLLLELSIRLPSHFELTPPLELSLQLAQRNVAHVQPRLVKWRLRHAGKKCFFAHAPAAPKQKLFGSTSQKQRL